MRYKATLSGGVMHKSSLLCSWSQKFKDVWLTKPSSEDNSGIKAPQQYFTINLDFVGFCHIVGMPDQDATSSYDPLLYSQHSCNEALIQWSKNLINRQEVYIYIYIYPIGLVSRVFANVLGDQGSFPGGVIKTQK